MRVPRSAFALIACAILVGIQIVVVSGVNDEQSEFKRGPSSPISNSHRKLFQQAKDKTERAGPGDDSCSKEDIAVYQGATAPLPSGIPTYTVEIHNLSPTQTSISNIHLSCAWFSSARTINPKLFRRLCYDDCLVNDGKPLLSGSSLSFQYANSFSYPLSVSSVSCS